MGQEYYEFDPSSIDGSDLDGDDLNIDNWRPSVQKKSIVQSKWRKEQIGTNFNQEPGIDELKKIHGYLNKKAPDAEIMKAFGITAETLIAIKKHKYDPVDGISLDNQSKIYKEFDSMANKIDAVKRVVDQLVNIFIAKENMDEFKKLCKKVPRKKKYKTFDNDDHEDLIYP